MFPVKGGLSLPDCTDACWGVINDSRVSRVVLKFDGKVAHRVKNVCYHPSQKIEAELPGGEVVVSYRVCGTDEMVGWLLQWKDKVEVLEPLWLRDEVRALAERIAGLYQKSAALKDEKSKRT